MGNLEVTPRLVGSLGEAYYKEYCEQFGGWAYVSLEQIHKNGFKGEYLEFKLGFQRFQIKIPNDIKNEIIEITQPYYIQDNNPSYVFDFLACRLCDGEEILSEINNKGSRDFRWIEVKTFGGKVSKNQLDTANRVCIPVAFCVVYKVKEIPYNVKVQFYYDYLPSHLLEEN